MSFFNFSVPDFTCKLAESVSVISANGSGGNNTLTIEKFELIVEHDDVDVIRGNVEAGTGEESSLGDSSFLVSDI